MVPSFSAGFSAEGVFDFALLFVEAAEFDGTEVDFPKPVVDFFECHELLSQEVADVDPAGVRGMPPLRLTRRTSKWAGYWRGGRRLG